MEGQLFQSRRFLLFRLTQSAYFFVRLDRNRQIVYKFSPHLPKASTKKVPVSMPPAPKQTLYACRHHFSVRCCPNSLESSKGVHSYDISPTNCLDLRCCFVLSVSNLPNHLDVFACSLNTKKEKLDCLGCFETNPFEPHPEQKPPHVFLQQSCGRVAPFEKIVQKQCYCLCLFSTTVTTLNAGSKFVPTFFYFDIPQSV